MTTDATLMVKCLDNEGVSVVFGLPGEENIRFVRALAASGIRRVLTRHEQVASFMAEMYGDQHAARCRRRDHQQHARGGHLRAGRPRRGATQPGP